MSIEQYRTFEEITTRNVKTTIEFTQETRKMVNALSTEVQRLQKAILNRDAEIMELKKQLAAIQTILFRGGTSGDIG